MRRGINNYFSLLGREMAFRVLCRHKQGQKKNILLYCMPRSGSTWMLNTIAAHPGMRYVGRPFMTALRSRWRGAIPDPGQTAEFDEDYEFRQFVHFEGKELERFERIAGQIVGAKWHIYPTLHLRSPYFNRKTDRVIFQVHSIMPLIEWFDDTFEVDTAVLLRHPIPNALSIMARDWRDEAADFLNHSRFRDMHLTGPQVDLGRKILSEGSELERQVLDWCLRMLVPIRAIQSGDHPEWLGLTYEQTVLEPEKMVKVISGGLDLPDVDAMLRQVRLPSRNVTMSTVEKVADPEYLLSRWRSKVGEDEEGRVMEIPAAFDLDVYEAGRTIPADKYVH